MSITAPPGPCTLLFFLFASLVTPSQPCVLFPFLLCNLLIMESHNIQSLGPFLSVYIILLYLQTFTICVALNSIYTVMTAKVYISHSDLSSELQMCIFISLIVKAKILTMAADTASSHHLLLLLPHLPLLQNIPFVGSGGTDWLPC